MNFDMKFHPLQMQSDYCHKVLNNLKISNKLEFPSVKPTSEGKDLPTTLAKFQLKLVPEIGPSKFRFEVEGRITKRKRGDLNIQN